MSVTSRSPPLARPGMAPPRRRTAAPAPRDARSAVRRIATLMALAWLVALLSGPFGGILLFVCGLAALAAYAAAHPQP